MLDLVVLLAPRVQDFPLVVHNQDRVGFVATLYFVNDTFAVNRHPRNKSRFPAGDGRLGREIHAL
ncbi:MAG TPA: hypothetical protein VIX19_02615, partial [Terriglobales bacterium]